MILRKSRCNTSTHKEKFFKIKDLRKNYLGVKFIIIKVEDGLLFPISLVICLLSFSCFDSHSSPILVTP